MPSTFFFLNHEVNIHLKVYPLTFPPRPKPSNYLESLKKPTGLGWLKKKFSHHNNVLLVYVPTTSENLYQRSRQTVDQKKTSFYA